ncbi:MAG: ribonuclease D [Gammaproteobacteria bacterium]
MKTIDAGAAAPATPAVHVDWALVDDDAALAASCRRWASCEALALDTEFMRVSTFYPKIALIQVADGTSITLIDPLRIHDWSGFAALMTDPAITKVMHSCSEDMLVFHTFLNVLPTPVFDTQIATALLNEGVGISYQNLVKQRFGIELPKGETRSDWLQRPLTAQQLEYAALDVAYLPQCWQAQRAALRELGREGWLQEDSARQVQQYAADLASDFSDYYRNFKAAWQLRPQQLAALQKLAAWREQRARKRDKPRSWIVKDTALFAFAQNLPTNKAQLAAMEDVSDNVVRFEGDEVLALIRAARELPEADCPPPLPKPLTQGQKGRLRKAQDFVEAKGMELRVPPEVLGRKRTLQALQQALLDAGKQGGTPLVPDELLGWRGPFLLEPLTDILKP